MKLLFKILWAPIGVSIFIILLLSVFAPQLVGAILSVLPNWAVLTYVGIIAFVVIMVFIGHKLDKGGRY